LDAYKNIFSGFEASHLLLGTRELVLNQLGKRLEEAGLGLDKGMKPAQILLSSD
jgi:hypothetical protein